MLAVVLAAASTTFIIWNCTNLYGLAHYSVLIRVLTPTSELTF